MPSDKSYKTSGKVWHFVRNASVTMNCPEFSGKLIERT